MFVVGGLMAAITGCVAGDRATTALCPTHDDLATRLEIAALIPGAIASCVRSHGRWLAGGHAVAVTMFALPPARDGKQSPMS